MPDACYVFAKVADFTVDGLKDTEGKPVKGSEVSFEVVVESQRKSTISDKANTRDPQLALKSLVPLYTFSNEDWETATEEELFGRFSLKSEMNTPGGSWKKALLDDENSQSQWLRVRIQLFPSLFQGQQLETADVLKMYVGPPSEPPGIDDWKILERYALTEVFSDKPFYRLARKQFPDAVNPDYAAMTIISGAGYRLTPIDKDADGKSKLFALPDTIKIDVSCYPSLDLVAQLQLKSENPRLENGVKIETLTPIDPFYLKCRMMIAGEGRAPSGMGTNFVINAGNAGWYETDVNPGSPPKPGPDASAPVLYSVAKPR
jgi:hypothetical protein